MAVKIRMSRLGRRHRPFYRINAIDSRTPRDGRILEKLGHYDPIEKDLSKQIVLEVERIKFWLDNGAIPSETVAEIFAKQGIESKHAQAKKERQSKARLLAKSKGRLFNKAQKIGAEKAAEAAKAEADAKAKAAEEEAKAKAAVEAAKAKAAEAEAKAEAEPKEQ